MCFYSFSWHNKAVPFSIQKSDDRSVGRYTATTKLVECPARKKKRTAVPYHHKDARSLELIVCYHWQWMEKWNAVLTPIGFPTCVTTTYFPRFFLSCTEYQMCELWRFTVHACSVPFSRAWQPTANVMDVGCRKCLRAYTARQHVALQGLPVSSFIMFNNSNRSSAPLKKKK